MSGSFAVVVEREKGLRHTLSAGQLGMIAIGCAVGTGLFLGSGYAISIAGPAVLISYAIGAVIALLLMGCLAEMTAVHPTSGSFGAYAEHYVSPLAGFLVRYAYWSSAVLAIGAEVTAIALYMQFWFPASPGWIWVVGFSALLVFINAIDVGVFGTVEYWFAAVKVVAIVAFILLAGYFVVVASGGAGFHNYTAHGGFLPRGLWGAWSAVPVAIFSYFGVELVGVAAGEAKNPALAATRAFRSTVVRLILFYLLTISLMLAIVPWTSAGSDQSPFVKVMQALHLPAAAGVLNFVILIAALSAMNSQLYVTTRMMFSLARAGNAPRALGAISSRGVPVNAMLVSTGGMAVAMVMSLVAPHGAFILLLSISVFGGLFAWMMIFVTHLFFRRAHPQAEQAAWHFHMWGFPVTTLLGVVFMAAVLLTTLFTDQFRWSLVTGVPFLLILTGIYRLRYRRSVPVGPQPEAT